VLLLLVDSNFFQRIFEPLRSTFTNNIEHPFEQTFFRKTLEKDFPEKDFPELIKIFFEIYFICFPEKRMLTNPRVSC
jgi:hypothetical protein